MEYCDGGTLENTIKECQGITDILSREKIVCYYLSQLKDALECIRKKKIIHRDLKPNNILLTKFKILKLADFGFARKVTDDEESETDLIKTICGSPLYMAPELLNDQHYHIKADLWSFGVIMYQLLYGHHPMDTAFNMSELRKKIKNKKINFHIYDKNYSSECIDLVSNLLEKNPIKRFNWNELFFHEWFKNNSNIEDIDIKDIEDIKDDNLNENKSLKPPETNLELSQDSDDYVKIDVLKTKPTKPIKINFKQNKSYTQSLYNCVYGPISYLNSSFKNITSY
jgi:serine/threonine protein kinase